MKKLFLMLLIASLPSFAQLAKVETFEPVKTNYVEKNGEFVARADIYQEYVDIMFHDKKHAVDVTVFMTIPEFEQFASVLLSYDIKDKEFFMMVVKRAVISIRFVEKYGYVQSYIYVSTNGSYYHWPIMNRQQYNRLFRG